MHAGMNCHVFSPLSPLIVPWLPPSVFWMVPPNVPFQGVWAVHILWSLEDASQEKYLSRSPNREDLRVSSQGRAPPSHSPHTQGWDWRSWQAGLGPPVWPAPALVTGMRAPISQDPCGSWEGESG